MEETRTQRPSPARERLLSIASELFYREGIHGVGVEKVLDAAQVTRATLYRHFAGKEALVLAYLRREDALLRGLFEAGAAQAQSPAHLVELLLGGIADDIERHHTRGCPFINASAEYPDAASEVRKIVKQHRDWFRATLEEVLGAAGYPAADELAGSLVLLRDAALVGGYLDGPEVARPTFLATANKLLS